MIDADTEVLASQLRPPMEGDVELPDNAKGGEHGAS